MKKIALLLMMLIASSIAEAKIYEGYLVNSDKKEYEDSIVKISIHAFGQDNCVSILIENKLDSRLYIEWENCRFNGEFISFDEDQAQNFYYPRQDEMLMARKRNVRRIRERSLSRSSVFEWDDKVAEGKNKVSLDMAFRIGDSFHDISIVFELKEE